MATSRVCSIPDCGKPVRARGWCRAHHYRWERYGDPFGGGTFKGEPLAFLLAAIERETDECIPWPYHVIADGYGLVWVEGRHLLAHRVVLTHTAGPPPTSGHVAAHAPIVCHNRACINKRHLRWATREENAADKLLDGTRTDKITEADVRVIRKSTQTQEEIGRRFGLSQGTVSLIRSGKRWKHVA